MRSWLPALALKRIRYRPARDQPVDIVSVDQRRTTNFKEGHDQVLLDPGVLRTRSVQTVERVVGGYSSCLVCASDLYAYISSPFCVNEFSPGSEEIKKV